MSSDTFLLGVKDLLNLVDFIGFAAAHDKHKK